MQLLSKGDAKKSSFIDEGGDHDNDGENGDHDDDQDNNNNNNNT